MNPFFTEYSEYLARKFPGIKVQKLSLDAGFSCPNRDGTISRGGCIYCNVDSFSPAYCRTASSLEEQFQAGRRFFARKYPEMKYLAYFQAYTGTFSSDTLRLLDIYSRTLTFPDVAGIVIATRPDCLPDRLLDALAKLNRSAPVILEIGAESSRDDTLRLINRGHIWHDVKQAVTRATSRGLDCGIHLIAGLPGETDDDAIASVKAACALPIVSLKLHQLQVIKGTPLASIYARQPDSVNPYTLDDYLKLCARIVPLVPRSVAIDRFVSQAPPEMILAPRWGIKNYHFTHRLLALLAKNQPVAPSVTV